ncbi:MAG: SAM-dependent methyltransferase [Gammaproteobacteria bacterium]|nr:SAM-dependent methyltransferase [Gammaproteobacteria bacterium]
MKTRLLDLDDFLIRHAELWRPQPYREMRPVWCEYYPDLSAYLLGLDDDTLTRLGQDSTALLSQVTRYIPELAKLTVLCAIPRSAVSVNELNEAQFGWEVPGRKKRQIERFSHALTNTGTTLLEWCGGKGHLGRTLGKLWQQRVETVEWNQVLCEEGQRLSARAGVEQIFHVEDALDSRTLKHLNGKHVLALHACGDLHRQLIHGAQSATTKALDIAPCCYHLGRHDSYIAFNKDLALKLSRDDMRLAVTGSETAPHAQLVLRDKEMAWKLGYEMLRRQQYPDVAFQNIRPIDKPWLKLSFEAFCEKLAQREGDELAGDTDWQAIEKLAWQRQGEVMRLSLLRQLFRRAIELWMVFDMATFLESKGYKVNVSEFCTSEITPRNILVSAHVND